MGTNNRSNEKLKNGGGVDIIHRNMSKNNKQYNNNNDNNTKSKIQFPQQQ